MKHGYGIYKVHTLGDEADEIESCEGYWHENYL